MKRVLHLAADHEPGDSRVFHKECRSLARAGYDVHLFVRNPPAESGEPGITLHGIYKKPRMVSVPLRSLPLRYPGMLLRMLRMGKAIVHIHEPHLIPLAIAWKLLRRGRAVYDVHEDFQQQAVTIHGNTFKGRLQQAIWRLLEGLARRVCDGIVCATPLIASHFPSQRTVTVCNYPRLEQFADAPVSSPASASSGVFRVCYAGGVSKARGIRQMIEAVQRVAQTHPVRLMLMGKLQNDATTVDMMSLSGWEHVQVLGWRSSAEVAHVLAGSHAGLVLLHPFQSYLDSLPIKMFEYMAAGIPVVASNFPLWRQILAETGAGVTVDPLDPEAIANALLHLATHPEEAAEMGRRGRRAVESHLNWKSEEVKLLGLYDRIAHD